MIIHSEQQMIALGKTLAKDLTLPATIELIGDIGTGKTTLTKGIAQALGIKDPITSPSFTISKTYITVPVPPTSTKNTPVKTTPPGTGTKITLNHFDFYRLEDPGVMANDLAESITSPHTLTIIEWAETVENILPKNRTKITISYRPDNSREVTIKK